MNKLYQTICYTVIATQVATVSYAACLPTELCAKVSGLQDVDFGTYTYSGDLQSTFDFCIYVQNDNENNYSIQWVGQGAGSAYVSVSGANTVTSTIFFADDPPTYSYVQQAPGVTSIYQDPNTVSEDCLIGGLPGRAQINMDGNDLEYATSGTYTGTVQVTVWPD